MSTFFSHLECAVPCGAGPRDPTQAHHRCSCGAPLLARYDLTAARRWSKSAIPGREPSMWRYRELLPLLQSARGLDPPVTLGEGWTPLVRARRLGAAAGLKRIYIKDEGRNPTGSFKARGMAAAFTRALHLGARVVVAGGSGHAGLAAAAYAARAAIQSRIVLPADVRPPIRPRSASTVPNSAAWTARWPTPSARRPTPPRQTRPTTCRPSRSLTGSKARRRSATNWPNSSDGSCPTGSSARRPAGSRSSASGRR